MVGYKFIVAVYINEEDTEKLMDFCKDNELGFEEGSNLDEDWQNYYQKEFELSGPIKRCYITLKTVNKECLKTLFDTLETADFVMMIECEIS